MVFDVPAERGGALTILENIYHWIQKYPDKSIEWFIIVSTPKLKDMENIKVGSNDRMSRIFKSW